MKLNIVLALSHARSTPARKVPRVARRSTSLERERRGGSISWLPCLTARPSPSGATAKRRRGVTARSSGSSSSSTERLSRSGRSADPGPPSRREECEALIRDITDEWDSAAIEALVSQLGCRGPVAEATIEELLHFGHDALPALREPLDADHYDLRRNVRLVLARLGDIEAMNDPATGYRTYHGEAAANARWLLECGRRGTRLAMLHLRRRCRLRRLAAASGEPGSASDRPGRARMTPPPGGSR